ncbi:SHOCT domain-containing protein [Nocardia cyriacigeorgica]|uniref:SHOCT domain-containing protein n=1 Tax=Nocardia cyriacigeorgica TaxID=135487 RepID=UPI001895EC40|nr:SHOCT domain-containing protein [Nocardia cyriacigeorgica]MBF6434841.1 SHOCT domain-containing protein [Nocardia cyriacigeorgica]MBF6455076.1 SHOCT domain-containing protein [Nocardia cyriacigeorgica]MBF6477918.1 SHOCT domain-containing protein [Nocardia cyriacigeorgica]MBF6552971.1 SHOCT domain-containing protein [Nocardia cyriacigeorgica]
MVFRGGRVGRPGLLGTVARTAVISGTARATANAVDRRAQRRAAESQAYAAQQQAPPPPSPPMPAPAPAAGGGEDLVAKLQQLGQLHDSGVLSDDEFAAAKRQLLG